MPDLSVVLITIRDGVLAWDSRDIAQIILIDWDELEEASMGAVCRAYKVIWGLPEVMRMSALTDLIGLVQRRFPLKATFQAWACDADGNYTGDVGPPVEFDATEALLLSGPDAVDGMSDRDYPTDDLAAGLPELQRHDGPFHVRLSDQVLEFIFADENEAHDAQA
ncbi:MAG TPA: hypothetical protein VGH33_28455 [Isosphaeraceae bacterium]|jgi:hypothetical protein